MTTHDIRPAIGQGVLHLFFKATTSVDTAVQASPQRIAGA